MSRGYDVGYARPPRQSRFKPGKSGNPKGRPKGGRNLKTELEEVVGEPIKIREGGKLQTISKQKAVLKAITNKAIGGDARAANLVLTLVQRLLNPDDDGASAGMNSVADRLILDTFRQQVLNDGGARKRSISIRKLSK